MRGIDFQIHFERIIQEMSKSFITEERPDTFTIFKFINQAQIRYLNEKYLSFSSVKDTIKFVQERAGDLNSLIKTVVFSTSTSPAGPYFGKSKYITLLDDYVYYIRSDSSLKRTDAIPINSAVYVPNKVVPHRDLDRLLSTPWNYPILRNPVVVFEEDKRIYVIHDEYTNTLSLVSLTYLRRPYNFDTSYEAFTQNIPNSSVPVGTKMRALTTISSYVGESYSIGDYFLKQSGYNTIGAAEIVCTPYDTIDETAECEFPYQVHDEVLTLAVKMYIEEAKFRLNVKQSEEEQKKAVTK